MTEQNNFLFLWEGIFLFIGSALETHTHEHHAIQIIISAGTPFQMKVENKAWKRFSSLIIDSDQPHQCKALNSRIFFLSIDPEVSTARALRKNFLSKSSFQSLPKKDVLSFSTNLQKLIALEADCKSVFAIINQFINNLIYSEHIQRVIDERIQLVIQIIKSSLKNKITLKNLAEKIFVSEGRLTHLFKEQVGIPIRKYILWSRLNLATQKIINNENFTQAAHNSGFSDSAHFSRTFTKMFGLVPSSILKNSQNIQAYVCSHQ